MPDDAFDAVPVDAELDFPAPAVPELDPAFDFCCVVDSDDADFCCVPVDAVPVPCVFAPDDAFEAGFCCVPVEAVVEP